MKLDIQLNLDDLFGFDDESVGTIIREEVKAVVRKELATALKNDPKLKEMINKMQRLAVQRAIDALSK